MTVEKSAAQRGGIVNYQRKETSIGPQIIITYGNGDKEWKYECDECHYNSVVPSRLIKNGGKFVKCLACKHKELTRK